MRCVCSYTLYWRQQWSNLSAWRRIRIMHTMVFWRRRKAWRSLRMNTNEYAVNGTLQWFQTVHYYALKHHKELKIKDFTFSVLRYCLYSICASTVVIFFEAALMKTLLIHNGDFIFLFLYPVHKCNENKRYTFLLFFYLLSIAEARLVQRFTYMLFVIICIFWISFERFLYAYKFTMDQFKFVFNTHGFHFTHFILYSYFIHFYAI